MTKIKVKSESEMNHFKLADSDDFFGFSVEKIEMPFWKQLLIATGMLAVLYFVLVLWFSF